MHNVFKGIIVGFIGFIIWFGVSVIYGIGLGLGAGENPTFNAFMFLGFFIMIGGPLVYMRARAHRIFIPVPKILERFFLVEEGKKQFYVEFDTLH